MFTFEIGHKYFDTSACDHTCVYVIEIVKRSPKMVTFRRDGETRRAKIYTDRDGEYIIPDRYSMAPVFRASREYTAEAVARQTGEKIQAPLPAEEAAAEEVPAAPVVLAAVGQRVVGNYGACAPLEGGVIIGFVEREATRWIPATTMAVVRWEDGRREYLKLSEIHPHGWRSTNGSGIGVFFAR